MLAPFVQEAVLPCEEKQRDSVFASFLNSGEGSENTIPLLLPEMSLRAKRGNLLLEDGIDCRASLAMTLIA